MRNPRIRIGFILRRSFSRLEKGTGMGPFFVSIMYGRVSNGDQAVIDMWKIGEYCLSEELDDGKHKARLFRDILGISLDNSQVLVDALKHAVTRDDAEEGKLDSYGQRWLVDSGQGKNHRD